MFPCNECAKIIIQSGVAEVNYFVEKRLKDSDVAYVASHKLLAMANIKIKMASFLEKATSALNEAEESVTATAESIGASLTDAQKTVAASTETTRSSITDAQKAFAASNETVKAEAAAAPEKVSNVSAQARDAVDNALSKGIEGSKSLLHVFEEKRTEVSSKLVGAVTNAVGGASTSSTVASRDLPISTDNQPLLTGERGVDTTPLWRNCCGVLDLLKTSTTK